MNKITRELNDKDVIHIIQNGAERDLEYRTIKQDIIEDVPVPTPSYLVYTAIVQQVGTNTPGVIVLENTIGEIVWAYNSVGIYDGTLVGAFDGATTVCFATTEASTGTSYRFSLGTQSADVIRLISYNATGSLANNFAAFIEIRVY